MQIRNANPKIKNRRRIAIKFLPSTFGSGEVSTTADGKTVYFVSDKRKGFGGTDIYVAHKKKTGKWRMNEMWNICPECFIASHKFKCRPKAFGLYGHP